MGNSVKFIWLMHVLFQLQHCVTFYLRDSGAYHSDTLLIVLDENSLSWQWCRHCVFSWPYTTSLSLTDTHSP